jgi:hypothetical protein
MTDESSLWWTWTVAPLYALAAMQRTRASLRHHHWDASLLGRQPEMFELPSAKRRNWRGVAEEEVMLWMAGGLRGEVDQRWCR